MMSYVALLSADITIPTDMWIIGNVDYMGFYRTNYDESLWVKLIEQLKRDHTVCGVASY